MTKSKFIQTKFKPVTNKRKKNPKHKKITIQNGKKINIYPLNQLKDLKL